MTSSTHGHKEDEASRDEEKEKAAVEETPMTETRPVREGVKVLLWHGMNAGCHAGTEQTTNQLRKIMPAETGGETKTSSCLAG